MANSSSLEKLVEATPQEKFKSMKKEFESDWISIELNPLHVVDNQKIRFREQVVGQKLEYIVNHPDEFDLSSRTSRYQKLDKEGQLTLLKDYLDRMNIHGEQIMEYYQRNNFGRYWVSSSLGLQNMKRKIRHALCADIMYDIDMKNAHPTLLSWYCHENGIKCEGLDAYIKHREKFMTEYMELYSMDRDSTKAHLLAIINGRKVGLKEEDPEWYKKFYRGMRHIMKEVVKINPDLYELAKKSQKERIDYNIEGTTVNYVMCKLENQALMAAFNYLVEEKIEVGSLVFDGLMIYKKDVSPERLESVLIGLSVRVKKVMGCEIIFTNKEMDEGYEVPKEIQKKVRFELLMRKGIYPSI